MKRFIRPLRLFSSNFVSLVDENSIVRKASWILAAEKVEGDYLEFGVYRGGSIIKATERWKRSIESI